MHLLCQAIRFRVILKFYICLRVYQIYAKEAILSNYNFVNNRRISTRRFRIVLYLLCFEEIQEIMYRHHYDPLFCRSGDASPPATKRGEMSVTRY